MPNRNNNNLANYSQPSNGQMYRNVAPQIVLNGNKNKNIVNSALVKQRESSPSRAWHSTRSESPIVQNSLNACEAQSRLLKFISQEAADNANKNGTNTNEQKSLYGGAKIPSKVFKQLQTEYSDSSDVPDSKSPTPLYDSSNIGADKPKLSAGLLRLLQSDYNKLQNDRSPSDIENNSVISSSFGEMEEYYKNGLMNTAATKESVMKELTTQFDPMTQRRKPRAAPGRVFRYLQQQYDNPNDAESDQLGPFANGNKSFNSSNRNNSLTNGNTSKFNSPTFTYLQSQYNDEADTNNAPALQTDLNKGSCVTDNIDGHDLNSLRITEDGDPILSKPYTGNRIPGRTFKMLQENYATHPSVLQARK